MVYSMTTKRSLSFALCALFMMNTISVQASYSRTNCTIAALFTVIGLKFATTKPHPNPVRYDENITTDVIAWLQNRTIKNVLPELWYLFADGLVGHSEKKHGWELKDGELFPPCGQKIEAKGLVGGYVYPVWKETAASIISVSGLYKAIKDNQGAVINFLKGESLFPTAEATGAKKA